MAYYIINFTATINESVSTNGIIRIAGHYNQYTTRSLISKYFFNKYFSNRIAVVINQETEVSEAAYRAAAKKSISVH
jgi:hypothetical protein